MRDKTRWWLRGEGLIVLAGALLLFAGTGQPWWLVPVVIFLPDISMVGYLHDSRVGALAYNLGHSYVLPAAAVLLGSLATNQVLLVLGLLWFAHIGMDRAMGYGLKHDDSFHHTHLGWLRPVTPEHVAVTTVPSRS